jgi:class 3 adenylate cyclase
MSKCDEISKDIQTTIDTQWNKRNGNKIPNTEDVALAGGAVEIDATFLYADLASSSKMAKELDRRVTAKILKSFLTSVSKLVKHNGGKIVSFDGDRVMGVFYGDSKNSSAAKCALQIKYIVQDVIKVKFEKKYDTVKDASFSIDHGVGIDTGTVFAVRGGVRGASDLIWIERAPNLAAKLSDIRESPYQTIITKRVYDCLNDGSKYAEGKNMWGSTTWEFLGETITVYRSSYSWKP